MKAIGFKNFRRFENFPLMELGDITMLVGGNNSGKSTVVKAILLVHHFLQTKVSEMSAMASLDHPVFTFDVPNVNIGTFSNALNRNAIKKEDDKAIEFNCRIGSFDFSLCISDHASWNRESNTLCDIKRMMIKDKGNSVSFIFDFEKQRMQFYVDNNSVSEEQRDALSTDIIYTETILIPAKQKEIAECTDLDRIIILKNELVEAERFLADAKKKSADLATLGKVSVDLVVSTLSQQDYYLSALLREFLDFADRSIPASINKQTKKYKSLLSEKQFIQSNKVLIEASIKNLIEALATPIESISAHVARQTIFFKASDKNDYMAQAIHEFAKLRINPWDEEYLFVDKWLQEFEIADGFRILNHGGEAYEIRMLEDAAFCEIMGCSSKIDTLSVKIDTLSVLSRIPSALPEDNVIREQQLWEKGEPLGSKGMGAIQITILLLQLATYMKKYKDSQAKPIILIEEPEQNLHPRFQSILADLFLEVSQQHGFSFLIETHSEYLIRKSQVIWAGMTKVKMELPTSNPFRVYYLSSKDLPYQMIYKDSGDFENEFEEGFFDEATNLIYQIL